MNILILSFLVHLLKMSLPIFKLGALLAKQLAKPLSKLLKAKATTNPKLKRYVILPTANCE